MNSQIADSNNKRPTVIILGAGFGGLYAARAFRDKPVDVLLIDRNNFHTFTPLLYQVATSALEPGEIAHPIRPIFRNRGNIRFLLGDVINIEQESNQITVLAANETKQIGYDYLIVATGSVPTYFGNEGFRQHAFELRTLQDAIRLRNHILSRFEEAVWLDDEVVQKAMLTIVVIGGGPTGLETAGAVYELYNHVLSQEYAQAALKARVILVEQRDHLLTPYPAKLQQSALRQVESLGVEVMLGRTVVGVEKTQVLFDDGTSIETQTLIWAAGMKGSSVAELLDVEITRGGRIPVAPTMEVSGLPHVYAVGDIAYLEDGDGQAYPMLIPVAQQQGTLAAQNILRTIQGESEKSFHYESRGIMATIGRSRAVAWIYHRFMLTGWLAWLAWLGLHLIMLLGFRNRLNVFINWMWNYFTYDRSVRAILPIKPEGERDT